MKTWSPEGNPTSEVPYVNGRTNGVAKTWSAITGKQTSSVTLENGVRNGPAQTWDDNGTLLTSGSYKEESWYPDPAPGAVAASPAGGEECSLSWINAFHKENGDDAMINSEQLAEWDKWCAEGKTPN
jgi:hypothetical protein